MKFGVVIFPGSNCDRDMIEAIETIGFEVIPLWHKDSDLSMFNNDDCIVLPGGFSYGDYLRCGAIARFSPMMQSVVAFANNGGRVIGICNGFQILCESGLLPGVLLANAEKQFICKNVYIINTNDPLAVPLKIPIAHGEGRYYASPEVLQGLEDAGQIIYRYCDEKGSVHDDHNPNGTTNGIAGIRNEKGNVFGMMPHPERACSLALGNTDGLRVFSELLNIQIGEAISV